MDDYHYLQVGAAAIEANMAREAKEHAALVSLPALLSGDSTWRALQCAIEDLLKIAPEDHDVLIQVGDIAVHEAQFFAPHTLLFQGVNPDGHETCIVSHYSQLQARIVYLPKRGENRRITGFSPEP
jgi:hypothetical protein